MSIVYYEDFNPGSVYWGRECMADKEEMLDYARKYDPWPFHVDEEAARNSAFGGLTASGGYIISLMYRSSHTVCNSPESPWAFQGGVLDWNAKFHLPVRPDDRLRDKITILNKRPSNKPGRGIVKNLHEMMNQDDQVVFSLEIVFLVATNSG